MITIIAVIGLVVMGVILGLLVTKRESCDLHWDYEIKYGKLSALETRVFILEQENSRLNHIYRNMYLEKRRFEYYAQCHRCNDIIRSKDMKDKEVADLLTKNILGSKEIAKKLGFELN